jgi:hypothetical protein
MPADTPGSRLMRLLHILPYAFLIVLAEVAVASAPAIVAVREGGMGLGSALIMAQAAEVAGIAFGAVVAAHLVDRWSVRAGLLVGAVLYYGGLIGVGHQPSHHLGFIVAVLGLAGCGLGMLLTATFSAAAAAPGRERPYAIAVLLAAPLVAGPLIGNPVFQAGPAALVIVAAAIVAGAVLIAWSTREWSGAVPMAADQRPGPGVTIAGAGLVGIGVLATLWGIEPSRVSATMVSGALRLGDLASLDGLRVGLVLIGLVAVAGGALVIVAHRRPSRATLLAAGASGAAALAAGGLLAVAGFTMPRELTAPDSHGGTIGELAIVAGGVAGLGIGSLLLARGARPRTVAIAGAVILAGLAALLLVGGGSVLRSSGAVGPIAAIAATALGAGLAGVGLRLLLAEALIAERGLAAGLGVAAAAVGALAGLMIGAGDGLALAIGTASGTPSGFVVLAVAALIGLGLAVALPLRRSEPGSIGETVPAG